MRIRGKFTKEGKVKFVGHLDTVRLFQRAIKVAGIPIAYSQGFNPHALVYFAMPLSVGVSSTGEYIEIITSQDVDIEATKNRLNEVLVNEIQILDLYEVSSQSDSLMSMVEGAAYEVTIPRQAVELNFIEIFKQKINAEEILIEKKGKKKVNQVDIKPLIIAHDICENEVNYQIKLELFAGSKQNLNPELLLKAILEEKIQEIPYTIERKELYTMQNEKLVPICDCEKM
ncbi:MAG: TIGR03936 family radical SAM-associated protein [Cellulosilyticaceae bacterium]